MSKKAKNEAGDVPPRSAPVKRVGLAWEWGGREARVLVPLSLVPRGQPGGGTWGDAAARPAKFHGGMGDQLKGLLYVPAG